MKVKAVFFDIDGTLISFNTHTIPQSTIDAIQQLKEQDINVFIATGRPHFEIPDLQGLIFDGFITLNGAYCLDKNRQVIHKNPIPKEDIQALITYLDTKTTFPCSFMCHDNVYINYVNQAVKEMSKMVNLSPPPVRALAELIEEEIFQVDIYVDKAQEGVLMEEVFKHCGSSRWHPVFADVNAWGSSKQTGIDKMIEHFGIDLSETMCFGDGGNDISMLKHTAIGIAMGNANAEVKSIAGYITDSVDNDGIKKALDHFIFNRL